SDDPDAAESELRDIQPHLAPEQFHVQHEHACFSQVRIFLYRQAFEQALALIEHSWKQLERAMLLRLQHFRVHWTFVKGRCLLGLAMKRPPGASLVYSAAQAADQLSCEGVAYATALGDFLSAGAAHARGERERAIASCRAAVSQLHD